MELLDAIKPIIKWVIKKIFLGWIFIWLWNKFIKQIIQEIEKRNNEILKNKKDEIELEKEKREHENELTIKNREHESAIRIAEDGHDFQKTQETALKNILNNPKLDNKTKQNAIQVESALNAKFTREQCDKLMPLFCDKKSDYTQDEYSKFHKLFSEYFFQNITDKKRKLIETLMKKVDKISTRAILFLLALDDNEIEILKKQFCYVFNGLGILYYNNIKQDFFAKELNIKGNLDTLKFINEIWQYNNDHSMFILPSETTPVRKVRGVAVFKELFIIEHPNTNKELVFKTLCHLTELGQELYSLFKEEIEEVPKDYITELMEYLHQSHQGHQFQIIPKSQQAF